MVIVNVRVSWRYIIRTAPSKSQKLLADESPLSYWPQGQCRAGTSVSRVILCLSSEQRKQVRNSIPTNRDAPPWPPQVPAQGTALWVDTTSNMFRIVIDGYSMSHAGEGDHENIAIRSVLFAKRYCALDSGTFPFTLNPSRHTCLSNHRILPIVGCATQRR